jgi:hypothetical protein
MSNKLKLAALAALLLILALPIGAAEKHETPAEFEWATVFESSVKWHSSLADFQNARAITRYEARYRDVKLNWDLKGKKFAQHDPALELRVVVDYSRLRVWFERGPGRVCEKLPDPWDLELPPPPDGVIHFGPEVRYVDEWAGAYYDDGSTVDPGTSTMRDGKLYRLVQLGERGSIRYVRMWVPVSDG